MVTQRKRKQQTRRSESPLRVNEPGTRNNYRQSSSGGNLTSVLVLCLFVAFGLLIFLIYLYNSKKPPIVVAPAVVEQKPAPVIAPKVTPAPVEEEKPPVVAKKKAAPAATPKKQLNLEITGAEKKTEVAKPAVEPESQPAASNNEDNPPPPKSFMGGLSNPEMEKNKDNSREERRKKKEIDLE